MLSIPVGTCYYTSDKMDLESFKEVWCEYSDSIYALFSNGRYYKVSDGVEDRKKVNPYVGEYTPYRLYEKTEGLQQALELVRKKSFLIEEIHKIMNAIIDNDGYTLDNCSIEFLTKLYDDLYEKVI